MPRALLAALGVLLAGFFACSSEQERRVVSAPPVATAPVLSIDLEDQIDASGEVLALQHAEIASEISGRITQIVLNEGSAAEEGATVVEIDPERRELELLTTRAGLVEAETALREQRREAERVRELHRRSVASEADLDQAETQLQLADSRPERRAGPRGGGRACPGRCERSSAVQRARCPALHQRR